MTGDDAGRWHARYVESGVRGIRTSSVVCLGSKAAARHYAWAADQHAGPDVWQYRRWRITPCDCPGVER